jgi:hypothetical protein
MQPGLPKDELALATAVFAGTVADVQLPGGVVQSSADPTQIILEVSQVWKGPEFTNLVVSTAQSSASCGFEFEFGRDYLVYASGDETNLQVSLCSRTRLLDDAEEDLTELGEAITPATANPDLPADPGTAVPNPVATPEAAQNGLKLPTVLLWGSGLIVVLLVVLGGIFSGPKQPRPRS